MKTSFLKSVNKLLNEIEFSETIKSAVFLEYEFRVFVFNFFETNEKNYDFSSASFIYFLEVKNVVQLKTIIQVMCLDNKEKETAKSLNFFFDLMNEIFEIILRKFGKQFIAIFLLSFFEIQFYLKFENLEKNNLALNLRFVEKLFEFYDKQIIDVSLNVIDAVINNHFRKTIRNASEKMIKSIFTSKKGSAK